ncbi:MAG: ABC transporter ATP-binding protein, partial [Rhodobacteraceae bacterium]|nr:ABC transporter ATP-binding protein [Paracoccaceae bacterium]
MKLAELFDAFAPADGAPPKKLLPFFGWCLSGSWPVLTMAAAASSVAGVMEVVTAYFLGKVIDAANASGPEAFFSANLWLLGGIVLFFMVLRPLAFGASS